MQHRINHAQAFNNPEFQQAMAQTPKNKAEVINSLIQEAKVVYYRRQFDHVRIDGTGIPGTITFFDAGRAGDAFIPGEPTKTKSTTNVQSDRFLQAGEIFLCFGLHTTFVPRFTEPGEDGDLDEEQLRADIRFLYEGGTRFTMKIDDRDEILTEPLYNVPTGITSNALGIYQGKISNQLIFSPVAALSLGDNTQLRIEETIPNNGVALPSELDLIQGWYLTGLRLVPAGRWASTQVAEILQEMKKAA